ncbi:MAG: hypothetical protein NVSMB6_15870 [Burkholderiaceae bacterium]
MSDDDFGLLTDWDLQKPESGEHQWSDDFSNLMGSLIAVSGLERGCSPPQVSFTYLSCFYLY